MTLKHRKLIVEGCGAGGELTGSETIGGKKTYKDTLVERIDDGRTLVLHKQNDTDRRK